MFTGTESLTPTISAPRHPTKPETTKPLLGAGALERIVTVKASERPGNKQPSRLPGKFYTIAVSAQ